jgi:hypothetical protein
MARLKSSSAPGHIAGYVAGGAAVAINLPGPRARTGAEGLVIVGNGAGDIAKGKTPGAPEIEFIGVALRFHGSSDRGNIIEKARGDTLTKHLELCSLCAAVQEQISKLRPVVIHDCAIGQAKPAD